jgi:hypothetical protein
MCSAERASRTPRHRELLFSSMLAPLMRNNRRALSTALPRPWDPPSVLRDLAIAHLGRNRPRLRPFQKLQWSETPIGY